MATRNLAPRANGEGSLGTASKKWGSVYANDVIIGNKSITSTATSSSAGMTKLYDSTGTNTDGTMTQEAITEAIKEVAEQGGGAGIELADVTNALTLARDSEVHLKWTDPNDLVYDGATLARWAGTKIVRKEGGVPENKDDGTVVLDSKTKNAYSSTAYIDSGLTNDTTYYYRLFPYSTVGTYTPGTSLDATPTPKPKATMSVSSDSVEMSPGGTATITVTSNCTGTVHAMSSDTSKATVSVNDKTVTVTGVAIGSATITILQDEDNSYAAPDDRTVSVTVSAVSYILNNNTWELISQVIQAGNADLYWDVGDIKKVVLNGNTTNASNEAKSFDNYSCYATILGFDHNASLETNGGHSIHFILGKDSTGKDINFYPYRMNEYNTASGGWNGSKMKKITMVEFKNCLPGDLRAVLRTVTKYTHNTAGGSANATENNVTATTEQLFLLSEFEVGGRKCYANQYEQNKQVQYDYYKNGNSGYRYGDDDGLEHYWWLRSVAFSENYTTTFALVSSYGSIAYYYYSTNAANNGYGVAPAFVI